MIYKLKEPDMKIAPLAQKPRAKWLNDILSSKRCARIESAKRLSRSQLKADINKEMRADA